jgi:hypothetical protein
MPFPLAHPAAVLPLRHVRTLCFPALVIGSLSPDFAYLFAGSNLSRLSHHILGSFLFCLPAGLLAFAVFELIRRPLVAVLPSPHRQALHSLSEPRRHRWPAIALSILIGAWTHILLDALTRESQILVTYLGPLRDELAALHLNGLRFSRLLWVALSFTGLTWITLAYLQLIHRTTGSWRLFEARETGRYIVWFCVLVVPLILVTVVTTAHAGTWSWRRTLSVFVYQSLAVYLVALCSLLTLIGFALRIRQRILPSSTTPNR